jgi:hypothetical protein
MAELRTTTDSMSSLCLNVSHLSVTRLENIAKPSQLHDLPVKKAASIPEFPRRRATLEVGENRYSVAAD